MTMRTAPWRPTKRRDEEEASTSGRDAREIVNDLVPLEHFSRVIRGRAREGGSETCALGTRGWVAKEARAGAATSNVSVPFPNTATALFDIGRRNVTCHWLGRVDHLGQGQEPAIRAFGGRL